MCFQGITCSFGKKAEAKFHVEMADRDSASESDSSSIDGGPIMMPPSPITREQHQKRIESLQQQNRVLKVELETYKLRVKALQEENRTLRQASVTIVRTSHS